MTGQPNVRFLMSDRHSPRITGPRITGCYGDPVVMPGDCLPRILATKEKT